MIWLSANCAHCGAQKHSGHVDTGDKPGQVLNVLHSHNTHCWAIFFFIELSGSFDFTLTVCISLYNYKAVVKTWDTFEDNNETIQYVSWLLVFVVCN